MKCRTYHFCPPSHARASLPGAQRKNVSRYRISECFSAGWFSSRTRFGVYITLPRSIASNRLIMQRLRRIDFNYRSPIVRVSDATAFSLSRVARAFLCFQLPRLYVMHRMCPFMYYSHISSLFSIMWYYVQKPDFEKKGIGLISKSLSVRDKFFTTNSSQFFWGKKRFLIVILDVR